MRDWLSELRNQDRLAVAMNVLHDGKAGRFELRNGNRVHTLDLPWSITMVQVPVVIRLGLARNPHRVGGEQSAGDAGLIGD